MTLDARFVTTVDLSPYLVDKVTGLPLANGTIEFYEDANRSNPKTVYELTGSPPNYTYTALPNPVPINAVGNISDNTGNNIALYYFPYDSMDEATANLQLYYVVVKDSAGNVQFTREAWPNITETTNPVGSNNNTITNQISNPQFVDVLFNPAVPYVIPFNGNTNVNIAPDWQLQITATGTGTVTVTRNAIAGSLQVPTNPPYTLSFNPAGDITALNLVQRLSNNPDIWSPGPSGTNGWVATNISFYSGSALEVFYKPSMGTEQSLLEYSNLSGNVLEFSNVVQLITPDNPQTGDTGYVDIVIQMATGSITTLTSVQVVGLETDSEHVEYNQAPVNRQVDQLFHYYNEPLQYKPIPSYLVGWDFPLNPAQALGSSVSAFATGANTSNYVWDQTICFQSANSGVSFSRDSHSGGLVVTGAATGQFALIQYLDMPIAYEVLNGPLSVNVSAVTNVEDGVEVNISLWYCTDSSLPSLGSNLSIVTSLNADGSINSTSGTWVQVPRVNLPPAQFTVMTSSTTNFNDYGFNGWNLQGNSGINSAKYFAIVIGFAPIASTNTITFNSISLVPGYIATRPSPQTVGEVLFDCQRYYETSYPIGTVPGTASTNTDVLTELQSVYWSSGASKIYLSMRPFLINFKNVKRVNNSTITLYSPNSGMSGNIYGNLYYISGGIVITNADAAVTYWAQQYLGYKSVSYISTGSVGYISAVNGINAVADISPLSSGWITLHYTADARLGVV